MSPRHISHGPHVPEFMTDRQIEQAEEQSKAEIRERVRDAAAKGRRHRLHPDDIKAAFAGHEDELAEVAQLRRASELAQQRRLEASDAAKTLRDETTRVLAQWDEDRRREAEREARRRLGMEPAEGDTAEAARPEREPVAQPAARAKAAKA